VSETSSELLSRQAEIGHILNLAKGLDGPIPGHGLGAWCEKQDDSAFCIIIEKVLILGE